MIRKAASLAAFGLAAATSLGAAPAAAQSLALVAMPVVFVSSPQVQATHQGRAIPGSLPAASAPQPVKTTYVPRATDRWQPSDLSRWQAPVAIDRSVRNYRRGTADYGPFRVLDSSRVALLGETDAATPRWFRALRRDFPGVTQIDMVECPGTRDDRANMQLGRMIRAAGLATYVPAIGSVRSGAVELFLSGRVREIDEGAEFAVHSWMDEYGREAGDFASDAPENRKYLDYYREMGMDERQARAFYDFTNSVPHARALWLQAADMRRWIAGPAQARSLPARRAPSGTAPAPRIDYGDVTFS